MRPVLKLHALRPAFRELGRPAAFVYEAQTRRVVWNLAGADAPDQGKFGTVAGRTGSGSTTPWCANGFRKPALGDPVDVRGVDYPAATAQRPEPDIVQHDVQPHSGVPAGAFGGTYRAQSGTNSRISRFTTPRDGSATAQPLLSGRRPLGRGAGYPSRSMCSS
jgi:hypothetical protein